MRAPYGEDGRNLVFTRIQWAAFQQRRDYGQALIRTDSVTVDGYTVRDRYHLQEHLPPPLFDDALVDAVNALGESER